MRVTTSAVAAFMAAICEVTVCLLLSSVICFQRTEAGSLPSSGSWALVSSWSVHDMITSWPLSMVVMRARWGLLRGTSDR